MNIRLEKYDSRIHDAQTVARLIFESDPEFNTLVYGKDAVPVIGNLLRLGDNYFDERYMRCSISGERIAGVIVCFPVLEKADIDRKSGKDFVQSMGLFRFLHRMPLFVRMEKMMPSVEDKSGHYIHTISVDSGFRGKGIGSTIIEELSSEHDALYLHVNRNNESAIRFYEKNGFRRLAEGSMKHNGKILSQLLMGRS